MSTQPSQRPPIPSPSQAGRRDFLKGSVAAAAAPLVLSPRRTQAQIVEIPPSPPVLHPWVMDLPNAISPLQPVAALTPAPTFYANTGGGECGRADHQRYAELALNPQYYQLRARENPSWVFNPSYPAQPIWGWQGSDGQVGVPGPTIFARYGRPIIARTINELPQTHSGFGSPEITTHLHNAHIGSESDGFPGDFFSPFKAGPTLSAPGHWQDHLYSNIYAGIDQYGGLGDPREALGTLFYHDHTLDFTAANVLKGLFGFYLLFDDIDSGDERDSRRSALRLPSHPYDYPLALQDMRFDANGMQFYDAFSPEGTLGDRIVVNGRIQPVLRVARRKYRLRLLDCGPSRFYALQIATRNANSWVPQPFTFIASDGNLLPRSLPNMRQVELAPAERADIVMDFSAYPVGTELFLVDLQFQDDTRGPRGLGPVQPVLKFIVDREPPERDVSRVPARLRDLPPISARELRRAPVRRFEFDRTKGQWAINNELFEVGKSSAQVRKGDGEIWELVNNSGGWSHPIHIHFEEGRILSKTVEGVEVPVPAWEQGRKDVYVLGRNTSMRVFVRFRDFEGKYVMHCHNLVHEDHAMMLRFDIRP